MEERFRSLADRRKSSQHLSTVFVLEHGLTPLERDHLGQAVLASAAFGRPERRHWLAWLVHATEVGYDYVGLDYWPTFQQRTPGWVDNNDNREWFRVHFKRFARELGGVEPSGAWAGQFSIICWPITHSILPQDLQQQFVASLDYLHGRFTPELLRDPQMLGKAIQSVSGEATSRFRQFIKNTELVGLIGSALLLQGESVEFEVVEPATLERIVGDLEKRRNAKDLLDRARARARHTIAMHGVGRGQTRLPVPGGAVSGAALLSHLGLQPTMVLRRDTEGVWESRLRLPDMSPALPLLPEDVAKTLLESRFRVSGDRRQAVKPGGALMYAIPDIDLATWPQPGVPLLQFEDATPAVQETLGSQLSLGSCDSWLFRLREDGDAHLVRGRTVRADGDYLVVVGSAAALDGLALLDERARFSGVTVARLWPAALRPDELRETCTRLSLSLATTVRARPAGLPPADWDGEGGVEWLATQPKVLGVTADCVGGTLEVRNTRFGGVALSASIASGRPAFIDLEPLEVGEHNFELTVTCDGSKQTGRLRVLVREPSHGSELRAQPLVITPSPRSPSLEELWDGRFRLEIDGPPGRLLRVRVTLTRSGSPVPLFDQQLTSLHLPVDAAAWRDHIQRHLLQNASAQSVYDEADSCVLAVDAKEFGRREFRMERDSTPLRWAISRHGSESVLELRDDTGSMTPPIVERFSFETPDVGATVDPREVDNRQLVGPEGGLYVATVDGLISAALVPVRAHSLADLACRPTLRYYARTPPAVVQLLRIAARWHDARVPGDLAVRMPMSRVLASFEYKLVEIPAGSNWMHAERAFVDRQTSAAWDALGAAVATSPHDRALVGPLRSDDGLVLGTPRERCERMVTALHLATAFSPNAPSKDSLARRLEFALRFASAPHMALSWGGANVTQLVSEMLESPVYLRLARWLVLATDAASGRIGAGESRPDWEW